MFGQTGEEVTGYGGTAEGGGCGAGCEWRLLGHGTCIVETGTDVSGEPACSSFKVEEWDMTLTQLMTEATGIFETLLPL
jgi:hypothetical protein